MIKHNVYSQRRWLLLGT